MSLKIVSNNSIVYEKLEKVEFIEGNYIDVLLKARDLLHMGYSLVSHPLPASIRMVFSPVRSIILKKIDGFDEESIIVIEKSLEKYKLTMKNRNIDFKNKNDYEFVDHLLTQSALEEYKTLSKLDI